MGLPKGLTVNWPELREDQWAFLIGYRGSIAHGMYVPQSDPDSIDDKDVMAIAVPPVSHYLGLSSYGSRGTREIMDGEWDIVSYELRKFMSLLMKGNPNVLSLLWLPDHLYIYRSPEAEDLIANRDIFLGKHLMKPFTGYAHGQLHRMTHHTFKGYMGAKRKKLVEKFGYDCKNASHLVRLLRMGIEILTEGVVHVQRHDSQQLLDIKRGEWSLERVQEEATRLFAMMDEAYVRSSLAPDANRGQINELCANLVASTLRRRGELT